jgi:hypothetical protein
MLDVSKSRLARKEIRIRNPGDQLLVVWLEPWSERFELEPNESLDVFFAGPKSGLPEVLPRIGEVSVYGWEGAAAVAFKDGSLAIRQPTVDEVVRQEFEIAKEHVARTNEPLPVDEIAMVQRSLDAEPGVGRAAQASACELVAILTWELASSLIRSRPATHVLWEIADRLLNTRGMVLAAPKPSALEAALWSETPNLIRELICKQAVSMIPDALRKKSPRKEKRPTRPRPSESESGSIPR